MYIRYKNPHIDMSLDRNTISWLLLSLCSYSLMVCS